MSLRGISVGCNGVTAYDQEGPMITERLDGGDGGMGRYAALSSRRSRRT
jgi:hypothetical protein